MSTYNRRTFLTTGATLAAGIGLASTTTAGATAGDADALLDPSIDPMPEMDEDWASYRGDPGHTRDVDATYEFDAGALDAAWSVDHDGSVAITNGTVYTSSAEGVIAVDAADGTVVWTNADVEAANPAVIGETVVLANQAGIVALDREDGRVRWERELAGDGEVSEHAVGYGGVYVVADGALYALEIGDGSTRWARDSVTVTTPGSDEEYTFGFNRSPAAANGVVYAATQRTVHAVEPTTGEDVWRDEEVYQDFAGPIHANSNAVIVDWWSDVEQGVHDAQTGELQELIWSETRHETTLGEEIYVSGNNHSFFASAPEGDDPSWDVSSAYNAGQGVVCGDTVYVHFGDAEAEWSEYDEALVALDKHDGSERWSLTTTDAPIGQIRAISDETLYVDHDGELVALRESTSEDETPNEDGDDNSSEDDENDSVGCSVDDADESATDDSDGKGDGDDSVETSDVASFPADGSPGFTTGAGLIGGALGLEWLRRRARTDESTE
ncbi:PQQ-binding-like beta-propeller repeat protein [Natronosalvus vescus]|uniref:outer membrane protein assembly factor BamB family protein n=1 Tax=Natronosalvus vescus TaxID=2953881 RepID=UPI0020913069|nr:PQQ-binding-like beta-propeller repeat protein [Natronosalvus vescus]